MVRIGSILTLIFVLSYAGVSIWYGRLEETLLKKPVSKKEVISTPPVEKTEIVRQPDDYTIIVKRNIFQAAVTKVESEPVEVEEQTLEPTKLKLSLLGTISGRDRDARAIISDDMKRQQDIYQVGDSVQGAIIKTIERGRVVLAVNNKDEILTLKDREGGGPAYQPSPSDFYKELTEPEKKTVEKTTTAPVKKQPTVRPRPVRRIPNLRQR